MYVHPGDPSGLHTQLVSFFSNHRISRLVHIFCDFKDNTQVLAQLTVGANIVISAISIANLVALISGAIFTSIFAYDTRCAMYPLADDVSLDCGLSCAFFSALVSFMSVSVAWVSEYVLIKNQARKSAGVGYWINAAIFGLFAIFVFTVLPSKLFRLLHLRRLWQQREALRQEAPRQEVQRQEAQRQEVQRQEVQRQEARRQEARKQEARRQRKLMKENLRQKASKHDKLIIDTRRQRPQVNHLQPTWQNRETGKWKDYPPPIEYRR